MKLLSKMSAAEIAGKKFLIRADFNVPLKKGKIADDTRIRKSLPTIKFLLENGGAIAICSHLGRPAGRPNPKYSLLPVAKHLEKLLKKSVKFFPNPLENKNLKKGEILLLQNTRFFPEETENNSMFAAALARGCDFFINDAFGTAHRAHASTVGVAGFLPSAAGFLLEKEISVLGEVLKNPARPLVLLTGGAKMKGKIGVLEKFVEIADAILLGGGIANTFLAATGKKIGDSLFEPTEIETAKMILKKAEKEKCEILLPIDAVVSTEISESAPAKMKKIDAIENDEKILDIGEKSAAKYATKIDGAKMLVWNGPVGIFELSPFSAGTEKMATAAAKCDGKTILGGGDTLEAIAKFGFLEKDFTHLSTGGGAMLEFLEGKKLPAIAILEKD